VSADTAAVPGHPAAEGGPPVGAEEIIAPPRGEGLLDVRQRVPALPGEDCGQPPQRGASRAPPHKNYRNRILKNVTTAIDFGTGEFRTLGGGDEK
jgi:hypothetical protein